MKKFGWLAGGRPASRLPAFPNCHTSRPLSSSSCFYAYSSPPNSPGGLPLFVALPAGGSASVVLTGALDVKGACRRRSAGWIHLDLGPSIFSASLRYWRLLCDSSRDGCDWGWGEILGRPAAGRDRGAVASNVPHGTGGVAVLCSLGCPVLFDCIDGAVSWFILGSPLQFERLWCPCCDVLGMLCGVLCLVVPSDYTGGTQVPWRRLGPGVAVRMYPMTQAPLYLPSPNRTVHAHTPGVTDTISLHHGFSLQPSLHVTVFSQHPPLTAASPPLHATASTTHLARISRIRQGGAAGLPVDLHGEAVVPEGDHHGDATCCSARRHHLLRLAQRQHGRARRQGQGHLRRTRKTVIKVGYSKGTICEAVEKLNVDPFILASHNHVRSCKATSMDVKMQDVGGFERAKGQQRVRQAALSMVLSQKEQTSSWSHPLPSNLCTLNVHHL
ncbi:uncharacterized protein LOC119279715 [Triticum dicoccoides]|uniref:uncharacterized protein LOC119279715 n=1 Tax=Triticum dicoccoides TaxID=85692 RepID=UPI0018901A61|nr:uncharacterized protein LOC119279715 [Triticum dicoccoides]